MYHLFVMRQEICTENGYLMLAMVKVQVKSCLMPMFRVKVFSLYVSITEPFAACSLNRGGLEGGGSL